MELNLPTRLYPISDKTSFAIIKRLPANLAHDGIYDIFNASV